VAVARSTRVACPESVPCVD